MRVMEIKNLPYAHFGEGPYREIRLVASPWTTNSDVVIVHCTLPPGSVSEAHIHPDADEFILFDIGGECEIDGIVHKLEPNSVIIARKHEKHEARNISRDQTLKLYCVFTPPFAPYGSYPRLIEDTKAYFGKR